MHKVTIKDFGEVDLGDKRRTERLATIINNISRSPGSSIPKQSGSWYDTKATYEFFKNEEVTVEALQTALGNYGSSQMGDLTQVLIAHDFSQISYNDLQAEGLGYLARKDATGIIAFSSIAVSTEGIPLSLLYQQSFTRPMEELGKARRRKETAFEDKESYHWYKGITAVNELLGDRIQKIHIADREADIYELFFCAYEANTDLLVRAKHPRKLKDGSALWDAIGQQEESTRMQLSIPDETGKKTEAIEVQIRYRQVEILRPAASNNQYESVEMTAIELKQVSDLKSWQEGPLHWKLLTTLPVNTTAEALQCVRWYCYRWLIERFHYVLKSGTRIEELQLHQASSLQKAIYVYSIAAMRIMQMVYQSRENPNISCEVVLTKEQWMALYLLTQPVTELPTKPPSLADAVRWIGKLGGHLGRKSDGPPGLKTVWLGYQRVCDAAYMYEKLLSVQNLGKA